MAGERAGGGSHGRGAGAAAAPGQGTAGSPASVPPPEHPPCVRPGAGRVRSVLGSKEECPGQQQPRRPHLPARFLPGSRRVLGGLDCAETAFNFFFFCHKWSLSFETRYFPPTRRHLLAGFAAAGCALGCLSGSVFLLKAVTVVDSL